MRAIFLFIFMTISLNVQSFDTSRYIPADLDELILRSKNMIDEHNHEGGFEVIVPPNTYTIKARLEKLPHKCESTTLQFGLKALNYVPVDAPENQLPAINTCIDIKSKSGAVIKSHIQDQVAQYIPKEIKIGDEFTLYVIWIYSVDTDKLPGFLITEFKANDT